MRKVLALLFLGALAGGISVSIYHAAAMEQLYWETEKLRVQLFETTERLQRLESLWATHQEGEILSVTVELNEVADAFAALELERMITAMTANLVGENFNDVNPALLLALLDNRKMTVEQKNYLVTVNWIIISREMTINLNASLAPL